MRRQHRPQSVYAQEWLGSRNLAVGAAKFSPRTRRLEIAPASTANDFVKLQAVRPSGKVFAFTAEVGLLRTFRKFGGGY